MPGINLKYERISSTLNYNVMCDTVSSEISHSIWQDKHPYHTRSRRITFYISLSSQFQHSNFLRANLDIWNADKYISCIACDMNLKGLHQNSWLSFIETETNSCSRRRAVWRGNNKFEMKDAKIKYTIVAKITPYEWQMRFNFNFTCIHINAHRTFCDAFDVLMIFSARSTCWPGAPLKTKFWHFCELI